MQGDGDERLLWGQEKEVADLVLVAVGGDEELVHVPGGEDPGGGSPMEVEAECQVPAIQAVQPLLLLGVGGETIGVWQGGGSGSVRSEDLVGAAEVLRVDQQVDVCGQAGRLGGIHPLVQGMSLEEDCGDLRFCEERGEMVERLPAKQVLLDCCQVSVVKLLAGFRVEVIEQPVGFEVDVDGGDDSGEVVFVVLEEKADVVLDDRERQAGRGGPAVEPGEVEKASGEVGRQGLCLVPDTGIW